jgi:hypothetical protein
MELALGLVPAATTRVATAPQGGASPLVQPPAASPTCRTADPAVDSPYLAVAHADAVRYGVNPLIFTWQICVLFSVL